MNRRIAQVERTFGGNIERRAGLRIGDKYCLEFDEGG